MFSNFEIPMFFICYIVMNIICLFRTWPYSCLWLRNMGTFIDSIHMKLKSPSKWSSPTAMHLLYRSNNFWKAPWKSSSSQPLSSPQLSHNNWLWAYGITKSHREQGLDYREGEDPCWCPSWSNSLWQEWSCGLLHYSRWKCYWPDLKSAGLLNSLKTST